MPKDSNPSISKTPSLKLKLKGNTPKPPQKDVDKTIQTLPKSDDERPSDNPYNRRRGASGSILVTYKNNEPSYNFDNVGGIHMGLIMKDMNKLHLALLSHQRDIVIESKVARSVSKPSQYNW
jgi:hypothetical protein